MGKKGSIFSKSAHRGEQAGSKKILRITLLLVIVGGVFFLIKRNIDLTLEKSIVKYEKEVALYQNKKSSVKKEIDTLSTLFHDVGKKVQTLEESVSKIEKKSLGDIIDAGDTVNSPESLSLSFLTSYTDTFASFVEQFAQRVDQKGNLFNDIPVIAPINQGDLFTRERGFGAFIDPFTGKKSAHNGVDFAAVAGTAVVATANGVVTSTEEHRFWGKRIIIRHKNSFKTYYAHLGTISVTPKQKVKKGDKIGTVGESGLVTGPHVHYELYHKGKPIDPQKYLLPPGESK